MNRGPRRTLVGGGLAHMPLLAILQAVICDCKPIQGSIRIVLYVNGEFNGVKLLLHCVRVELFSTQSEQPYLAALACCILIQRMRSRYI